MIRQWWGGFAALAVCAMPLLGHLVLDTSFRPFIAPQSITVIDGDTMRLGDERIRLNGIDAPEMPGHCRAGRDCAPGDPFEAKAQLAAGFALPGEVSINRLKTDRYGRTIAQVRVGDVDLSCWMVEHGAARYVTRWDEGRIMEGSCE